MNDDRSHLNGAQRIAEERHRQIALGWSLEHDQEHDDAALVRAAIMYCAQGLPNRWIGLRDLYWPWEMIDVKKLLADDPIRNLEKAGALIAAEIDRLVARADSPPNQKAADEND